MQHLTLETMARLIDEPPDAVDAAHLDACDACRAEFDALRADVASLAVLPPIAPPDAVWHGLERRARAEGLIRTVAPAARAWGPALLRLAASILVFAVGAASGLAWARSEATSAAETAAVADAADRDAARPLDLGTTFVTARQPTTTAEADLLLEEAEAVFYYALRRAAEMAPDAPRQDMLARLATLESITNVTGTALSHAPADPVINGYYLAARAQRDAMLQRVSVSNVNSW